MVVGLIGLEPMTLRLSSACSNQLSYRPGRKFVVESTGSVSTFLLHWTVTLKFGGGTGTRTPDIQLAKLALYQLSYTPRELADS